MASMSFESGNGLTKDEIGRIGTALECPEFRQLLVDYVKDVKDPKNREIYEKEVQKVEKERGYDVTFVHPEPCYVVKTRFRDDCIETGPRKVFVNIASNENIENSSCERVKKEENGLSWSIPHSFSPQRRDFDKKGLPCAVYDCVFHPHTLNMALNDPKIKSMVENVALNGIETKFKVFLDRSEVKYPKMTFKGPQVATLIRKKVSNGSQSEDQLVNKMIPDHSIKYRHHVDIQDYAYSPNSNEPNRPDELVIEIKLPLIGTSEEVHLDVQPNELFLKSVASSSHFYDLELKLPCAVREDEGTAKFDLELNTLTVVLPTYKENKTTVDDERQNGDAIEAKPLEEQLSKLAIAKDNTKTCENDPILKLPELSCHQDDQEIVFVLKTENVDRKTMKVEHLHDGMACQFRYESNCEVPIVYSLFLRFPCPCKVEESVTSVSINEDSVVVIFKKRLTARHNWTSYFYDIDGQQELKEAKIEVSSLQESLNALWNDSKKASEIVTNPLPVSIIEVNPDRLVINVKFDEQTQVQDETKVVTETQSIEDQSQEEHNLKTDNAKLSKRMKHKLQKLRSVSESSDDLNQSPSRHPPRGILKHARRKTLSESSDDVCYSSSLDYTTVDSDIPEEDGGEERSSVKKSVHFNHVVMKNVFRLNSIIARQLVKGKTQQRKQRKKRLMEQRHNSESDYSEGETIGSNVIEGTQTNLNTNVDNSLDNLNGNVQNPNLNNETKRWPKNDNIQTQGWKINYNRRKIKRNKKIVVAFCDNNNKPLLADD